MRSEMQLQVTGCMCQKESQSPEGEKTAYLENPMSGETLFSEADKGSPVGPTETEAQKDKENMTCLIKL